MKNEAIYTSAAAIYAAGAVLTFAYGWNQGFGSGGVGGEGTDEAFMAFVWPIYWAVRLAIIATAGWDF